MSAFVALWLPTIVSAVAVFVLSSILHMAFPFWHRSDYTRLPDENAVLDGLRPLSIPPGEYFAPLPDPGQSMKSPEFVERMNRGPRIILNVARPGMTGMGRPLGLWFLYCVLVAALAGHVAYGPFHESFHKYGIFHTVALTAFLGFAAALWQGVIWFQRPWIPVLKSTIDSVLYAVAMGWIFVYFWPVR